MRRYVLIGTVLVAAIIACAGVAGLAAPNPDRHGRLYAAEKDNSPAVDVELVLAVDVSYSMDLDELAVQREGYAQAIVSKEFLQALKSLPNGRISITYFEWAASNDQKIVIPWRLIDGPETADAVAQEILKTPIRRASRTSISGAIYFAMKRASAIVVDSPCAASSSAAFSHSERRVPNDNSAILLPWRMILPLPI